MHSSILNQEDTVMENNVSIELMVKNILTLLRDSQDNLRQLTIRNYELSFEIILSHLNANGILMYDKESVFRICSDLCNNGGISKTRIKLLYTALMKLDYYFKHCALMPKNHSNLRLACIDREHERIVSNYLAHCRHNQAIKEGTLRVKRVYGVHFMNYLSLRSIQVRDIDGKTILDYLATTNNKAEWTETTKNMSLYELRKFLTYLMDEHGVRTDAVSPLHVIFGCHTVHLPAYYEPDEVKKLVNSIDVSSPKGKRDYLICLLVSQLGMRAGDVSRLEFSNIHWDRDTIEIVQQKTGNPLVLPLLGALRFALLDYWKNSRQDCESDTILITLSKPHRCLSNAYLGSIIKERLEKAGIDISARKHGCHSMRHSLARNLLSGNEALSTITGILGHENSNTTRRYLGIDTRELRHISLEVPDGRN